MQVEKIVFGGIAAAALSAFLALLASMVGGIIFGSWHFAKSIMIFNDAAFSAMFILIAFGAGYVLGKRAPKSETPKQ